MANNNHKQNEAVLFEILAWLAAIWLIYILVSAA